MSFFSIIIPAYGNDRYLPACLDSVRNQSFRDWNVVVVVDASPDSSAEIARRFAARDPRFRVIEKSENQGLHLARLTGVEASTGAYSIFLDADDELHSEALSSLYEALVQESCDILHFGINAINAGVSEEERSSFEAYINAPLETLRGREILRACCDAELGYRQDWRVTQRAYETGLLKRAFRAMTDDRLDRAEDSYEFFVIADLAVKQVTRNDIVALDYYYGRGVNSSSNLSALAFMNSAHAFCRCMDKIDEYAAQVDDSVLKSCSEGARAKLVDLLMNDWAVRVSVEDREETARDLAKLLGGSEIAAQLARLARDVAYEQWVHGDPGTTCPEGYALLKLAQEVRKGDGNDGCYDGYAIAAQNHLTDISNRAWRTERDEEPVRIFVTTHKPVDLFDSKVLQPVQVGAGARMPFCFHDDDGENIADKNPLYCELTTQYWAWKNVDAEYCGFCHYRRYFDFSSKRHEENGWGEIMDRYINGESQREYGLDDASIRKAVEGYDVITTEFKDLRDFPSGGDTPLSHYQSAPRLHFDDLKHVISILKDMHPDYATDADEFLNGHVSCFCNMYIMRKSLFNDYCAWLFPILERFVNETDMSHYSREALRTPGHLSERLFNIYYKHQMRVDAGWKTKQVQCVHFERPDKHVPLQSLPQGDDARPIIPVVLASDNNYVPMLTTTMYSMLANASTAYRYDITVLERDISGDNQAQMRAFFGQYDNVNLRFYNVSHIVDSYKLGTSNEHISVETYYRFLIQDVLPFYDKVLYLDSDLIVKGDVAELYGVELGTNLLAAAHDIDYLGNLNMNDGARMAYSKNVLNMHDPYAYFQAGVLVLNTGEMRKLHTVCEWLELAAKPHYIYDDQDVLNAECEGRVTFLDFDWNVMIDCAGRIGNVFTFAPASILDAFLDSRNHEKIVHYAGFEKPWKTPTCDRSELYWSYARKTPFYEKLLAMLAGAVAPSGAQGGGARIPDKAMSEGNPLRRILDPLMPLGTNRREVAKAIGRTLRGRH